MLNYVRMYSRKKRAVNFGRERKIIQSNFGRNLYGKTCNASVFVHISGPVKWLNCAFSDTSAIFRKSVVFDITMNIRYGTVWEINANAKKLKFQTFDYKIVMSLKNINFHVHL